MVADNYCAGSEFDRFADEYEKVQDSTLPPGVRSKDFLKQKFDTVQEWVRSRLQCEMGIAVLDFGCGTGRLLAQVASADWCRCVVGVDESAVSLERTRSMLAPTGKRFWLGRTLSETGYGEQCDLVLMFNVLHHISSERRLEMVRQAVSVLRQDGLLAVWEHNPFNLITRALVAISPLDGNAELISHRRVSRLMGLAGIDEVQSRFVNIFPPTMHRHLSIGRMDAAMGGVPLGAQYWALFRLPVGGTPL